ncbi:hypothetical protein AB6A40_007486 [Gnathostoma spinigerum]|uniref:NR LBD domain-containing protein n=1 Tax=Gnathostoma spinigerum TaxID=75299 RepID=A0ABD6EVR5_9BILA
MSSYSSAKKVCEMEVQLVTNIINDYFPPFKDLPFDEKVALFRNFLCHFSISDRAYQSYLIFGMNKSDDRLLMSDGGYIKTTELAMFYKDSATRNAEPEEAARIFLPAMTYIVNVILGHMKRISITDVEFMVVVAMFLWDDALSTISEQTQSIICDTRDKIFAELNSYYKSLGMTDQQAAVRMGNLLILLPKMQQSVKMYRENCELAELFNILEVDQCGRSFKPE